MSPPHDHLLFFLIFFFFSPSEGAADESLSFPPPLVDISSLLFLNPESTCLSK
jgi:hypothetical protein